MDNPDTAFLKVTVDTAATRWGNAISEAIYLVVGDTVGPLSSVLRELIALASAEEPDDEAAQAVGARLAAPPFDQVRMIRPTVTTLVAIAPDEEPARQRWASVVGHAVDGYSAALRERALHQQEQILAAAISVRTSEVITLQEQLRHQATHDALTGLANRAHLQDSVDAMLATPQGLGLLIIDLDSFKFINDRYGHAVGDEVLVVIGRRLLGYARPEDIVARYGGDEFIVATRASEEDVGKLADRMVIDMREPVLTSAGPISVAASIGIAYHDGRAPDDFTTLLRAADHEMYESKAERTGRSRRTAQ